MMKRTIRVLALALMVAPVAFFGCGDDSEPTKVVDAARDGAGSQVDGGPAGRDSGTTMPDASIIDAPVVIDGAAVDAAVKIDGTSVDGTSVDVSAVDGTVSVDGRVGVDATVQVDTGAGVDSGAAVDTGRVD